MNTTRFTKITSLNMITSAAHAANHLRVNTNVKQAKCFVRELVQENSYHLYDAEQK